MSKDKQIINCTVYDCKHCNCDDNICNLKAIKVCCSSSDEDKESTMCDSYKRR